jgi:hypothetical protein
MKVFNCDNCELYLPTRYEHSEKDICTLCIAHCDYDDAEDYKEKSTAQEQIDTITEQMKKEDLYPYGLCAEDMGLDL